MATKKKSQPKFKVGDIVKPVGTVFTREYLVTRVYKGGKILYLGYDDPCEYCDGRGTRPVGCAISAEVMELVIRSKK